jgi:DNA helicase II / ATP-dependent DNA helicase PcrA
VDDGALLEELTPEQSAVVLDDSAFIRVIAAAGSGKTKTLVAYVLRQMLEGIDPSEIVVFTFTEKAANELRARIYALAASLAPDLNLDGIYVGTIHGWCFQLLQSSSGFSDVLVLDELHLQALFLRLYDQLGISEYSGFEFPKGVQIALDDMELAWNEGVENVNSPALSQLYESFEDFLSQNRMTTYGSMQHAALKIIQGSSELQTRLVCVDEYQDVNSIQEQLVSALHSRKCKIFAVGDPRQSIYQWRGADPNRLMLLDRKFTGVSGHELNTNFLNFGFVGPMKQFRSGLLNPSLAWAETSHPVEQAEQMAEWILQLHSNGAKWGDIAILMRSVKHNIEEIMSAFTSRDIPVGGSISSNGSDFVLKFVVPVLRWLVSASSWR